MGMGVERTVWRMRKLRRREIFVRDIGGSGPLWASFGDYL